MPRTASTPGRYCATSSPSATAPARRSPVDSPAAAPARPPTPLVPAERDALLAEALRLTGDPDRAEDAVQRALTRTRLHWGRRGSDPATTAADALHSATG